MELTPHNPEEFGPAKIDVGGGYRLLNYEEFARETPEDLQYYSERSQKWVKAKKAGQRISPDNEVTYRTRTLVPVDIEFWESNPENYDPEHLGRDEGWRPLLLCELPKGQDKPDDLQYYSDDDEEWMDASQGGTDDNCYDDITYRTQSVPPMNPFATYVEHSGDLFSALSKLLGG
jgi:hypothetical protein